MPWEALSGFSLKNWGSRNHSKGRRQRWAPFRLNLQFIHHRQFQQSAWYGGEVRVGDTTRAIAQGEGNVGNHDIDDLLGRPRRRIPREVVRTQASAGSSRIPFVLGEGPPGGAFFDVNARVLRASIHGSRLRWLGRVGGELHHPRNCRLGRGIGNRMAQLGPIRRSIGSLTSIRPLRMTL